MSIMDLGDELRLSRRLTFASAMVFMASKVMVLLLFCIGFFIALLKFSELPGRVELTGKYPPKVGLDGRSHGKPHYLTTIAPFNARAKSELAPAIAHSVGGELTPSLEKSLGSVDNPGWFEPAGCRPPSDDYERVQVGEWTLNRRTLEMLTHAAKLYDGPIDILGASILRGSYLSEEDGANAIYYGGGVVDIKVTESGSNRVLYREIDRLIRALRVAGFGAWFREGEDGESPYIHAVAIGDRELSPIAQEELSGKYGYFRGYEGIRDSEPQHDSLGGPLICSWMVEEGFRASEGAHISISQPRSGDWRERLRDVAQSMITSSPSETVAFAKQLGFQGNGNEDPSNMCGPLSAAILRDAGLLPSSIGPVTDLKRYWLADPLTNGRPWALFPMDVYDLYHFDESIAKFDFTAWPLYPGDFVYAYSGRGEFSHMFVVTEVDERGRAYTVTNQKMPDGSFLVANVLLYDPTSPVAGAFRNVWTSNLAIGRTGLGGFDVLRRKGVGLSQGSAFAYTIMPGDTLDRIADHFNTSVTAILSKNMISDPRHLTVGQTIVVPVNLD